MLRFVAYWWYIPGVAPMVLRCFPVRPDKPRFCPGHCRHCLHRGASSNTDRLNCIYRMWLGLSIGRRGKKYAWNVLKSRPSVTQGFHLQVQHQNVPKLKFFPSIEIFVVLLYDWLSECVKTNQARWEHFTEKDRSIGALPPTSAALLQNWSKSDYQAGFCWGRSLVTVPTMFSLQVIIDGQERVNKIRDHHCEQFCFWLLSHAWNLSKWGQDNG